MSASRVSSGRSSDRAAATMSASNGSRVNLSSSARKTWSALSSIRVAMEGLAEEVAGEFPDGR